MLEQGSEVKGASIYDQKPVQGTEKQPTAGRTIFLIIIAIITGLLISSYLGIPIFQPSLTTLDYKLPKDSTFTQPYPDLNSCLKELDMDEFYLKQIGDLNFPYLTINFPLKLNTFQGIVLVDNNKIFALDVNTMRRLVQEYGVTR